MTHRDNEVEQRTALANIPAAIGLLTSLASGSADEARNHIRQLIVEDRAEGVIKALCVLVLNTGDDRDVATIRKDLRSSALTWAGYADLAEGERVVDDGELAALVHEHCECGHTAAIHTGRLHWVLWDVGAQTTLPCDECPCQSFA